MPSEPRPPHNSRSLLFQPATAIALCILTIMIAPPFCNPIISSPPGARTKSDALQVRQAIETYFTEYRRYPAADKFIESPSHPFFTDHELMDILLASTSETHPEGLNPRNITFYAGRKAKGHPPHSGVVLDPQGGGELFDRWGSHFRVLIDLDRDDRVTPPHWDKSQKPIPQGVIVWSPGPDGDDSTADDNITTW